MIGVVLGLIMALSPALAQEDVSESAPSVLAELTYQELAELPYDQKAYQAQDQLGMDPELAHEIRAGLALIYERKYQDARRHFKTLDAKHPELPLSGSVNTLIWQALMLENWDYKFESQWKVSSGQAQKELHVAFSHPGNEGLEYFLMAGVLGMEAIHTMRRERYLGALQKAFEAMDYVSMASESAPDFADLGLATGMFNYWRTVVSNASPLLPDYGDHREEGIKEMEYVQSAGLFLGPPTSMALVFTWFEERDHQRALSSCMRNRRLYPDNVINNSLLGQTYIYLRMYDEAVAIFDEVLEDAPKNRRAHYWKGVALHRARKSELAEASIQTYIEFDYLEDWQRSSGHYRLGQIYERRGDHLAADKAWKKALKYYQHKGAKRSLDRLRKRRRTGEIRY